MTYKERINETTNYLLDKIKSNPDVAIILGSGLGDFGNKLEDSIVIPYGKIPNFKNSTAVGHAGELVFGNLGNKTVLAMKGRFHFYEGYHLEDVTFPVRVFKALGVKTLIITNAAGAVNKEFKAGELMLITDHLNLVGINPLIGENDNTLGPRFPDLSQTYNKELRSKVKEIAALTNIKLNEGVYAWFSGPTYETPAEIKMVRNMGADAVGMSTVPEAIVAAHSSLPTVGISCLTNMAAGILDEPLTHEDVVKVANLAKADFTELVEKFIKAI